MSESRKEAKIWSLAETAQHEDAVEAMLRSFRSGKSIEQQLIQPSPKGLGLSRYRVRLLVQRVQARWTEEDKDRRAEDRRRQIRLIEQSVQQTMGRQDPNNPGAWLERPNHSARARYLELLSRITGTEAPIEIDVNVEHRDVMVAVFSQYTLEDLEELHESATRKRQLAERYLAEHPEEEREAATIDVKGEAAE